MGPIDGLLYGFSVAMTPGNLFACFIGVLVGTIVGVLPGIGPVGAMALLLPSTFALHPATALIMLAGIYYGSMYGGSTTPILVNVPGEAGSVVTLLDGYQMTRQGRAGAALVMVAIGLALGTVGMDSISALRRFTFGSVQLAQGVELVPVIMGLYGVAEILLLAEEGIKRAHVRSVRLRE